MNGLERAAPAAAHLASLTPASRAGVASGLDRVAPGAESADGGARAG